jgi:hypothetical protein
MLTIIQTRIFGLPVSYINIKIKIYKIVILPVVLHGCETWSFTLREKHRLRIFENRVLRRIFGSKMKTNHGENYIMKGGGVYRVLIGMPKGKNHWKDLGIGGKITLRWSLGRYGSMGRSGFGRLRVGSSGGLL